MKRYTSLFIWASVIVLFACGPKPVKPPPPVLVDTGDKLLESAEQFFRQGAYQKAMEAYRAYLLGYSERPLAPAALFKIGEIHSIQGNMEEARRTFAELISRYPESPYVLDARIGSLATEYHSGQFQKVLQEGAAILKDPLLPRQAFRLYTLLGDASLAAGAYGDGFYYYGRALGLASEASKGLFRRKLKEIVPRLAQEDMSGLLDRMGPSEARGDLLLALAGNYADRKKYEEAIRLLSDLLETLPDHPDAAEAKALRDEFEIMRLQKLGKMPFYSRDTIGCILPLTGAFDLYGNKALKGVELALNDFSAEEMNPPVNIRIKDTGSNTDQALHAVAELAEEKVAAIIGPITTVVSAAFEAQERGIPIITLTQRDDITIIGEYVFRNFITPKTQVKTIVDFAVRQLEMSRFAILYPDEPYGKTFMNLFWDEVMAHGGRIVGVESYDPSQTDFADPIKKIVGLYYEVPEDLKPPPPLDFPDHLKGDEEIPPAKEEEPKPIVDFDAVFIPDAPKKVGLVIPQLVFYDVEDIRLMGTNLWHSDQLIQMAGQYAQGAVMADGFYADSASEAVRHFTQKFQAVYGERPGIIEAIAYDTTMMLLRLIRRPEIGTHSELKDALLGIDPYPGLTGLTRFDETGDSQKRLYLLQIKRNRFVELNHERAP